MVKIKICGLTRLQDIEAVNIERPNFIGFVFAQSKRRITPGKAAKLRSALHPEIIPVGVFVNEQMEDITFLVRNGVIDMIQLHGSEDESYIRALKTLTDTPLIKAVSVQKYGDAQKWEHSFADYLLLDHKGGGTGQSFNWDLIGNVNKPYFLAGGINLQNVESAIKQISPFAVDVSSGVETDGIKDPAKIKDFVHKIKEG